jgi:hypothetical protein
MTTFDELTDAQWDQILTAFGNVQSWLCTKPVIDDGGWCRAWDLSQELYRSLSAASHNDGRTVVEVHESCNPEMIELVVQFADAFERLQAPVFIVVPFDLEAHGIRKQHLLNSCEFSADRDVAASCCV